MMGGIRCKKVYKLKIMQRCIAAAVSPHIMHCTEVPDDFSTLFLRRLNFVNISNILL